MERDLTLLRDLMLAIEKMPSDTPLRGGFFRERFPDTDPYDLGDHVHQLIEAGLLEGKVHFYQRQSIPNVGVDRITTWGHDFIRSVKDDTVWNKVKDEVIDTGKAFTLSMLIDYMKTLAAEYL